MIMTTKALITTAIGAVSRSISPLPNLPLCQLITSKLLLGLQTRTPVLNISKWRKREGLARVRRQVEYRRLEMPEWLQVRRSKRTRSATFILMRRFSVHLRWKRPAAGSETLMYLGLQAVVKVSNLLVMYNDVPLIN